MNTSTDRNVGFGGTFVDVGMMCRIDQSAGMGTGRKCMVEVLAIHSNGFCDLKIICVGKNTAGWKSGDKLQARIWRLEGVK